MTDVPELPRRNRGLYILDGHTPVNEPDLLKWAQWYETADRQVAFVGQMGGASVSTVFLAIDYNFLHVHGEAPLLFETKVFGGPDDGHTKRYATWDEAMAGHLEVVKMVLATKRD